uniref:Uncharacterized protein n=1 Tax=Arundo donax TaxID=35708 RepID=A0A0A9AHF5_ARUDO
MLQAHAPDKTTLSYCDLEHATLLLLKDEYFTAVIPQIKTTRKMVSLVKPDLYGFLSLHPKKQRIFVSQSQ